MPWKIEFEKSAEKQLRRLDKGTRDKVLAYMHEKVAQADDPRDFGHSLNGEFAGQWTYRIGDYRAVCHLHFDRVVVEVVKVGNRREVYR